jgi:hypothetical protein
MMHSLELFQFFDEHFEPGPLVDIVHVDITDNTALIDNKERSF